MGIRMDQWIGLNERAQKLVKGKQVLAWTEQVTRVYPDGRKETLPDRKVFASTVKCEPSGEEVPYAFGDGATFKLDKYTLPNGTVYFERMQAEPWSSGPCYFTALQTEDGKCVPESCWTEREIEQNL